LPCTYETADHVSSAPRYVREKGTSELMVVFTDAKRSSNLFTILSVKKDTLSLVVATGVVLSDPLMGGRSNMSWVSMIYYYPITCLGDRGPNLQDHLLRSESRPDLCKHALCRRQRQVPVCGQVCRPVYFGQLVNELSGIFYRRFKGYTLCNCLWLQLASNPPRYLCQCMGHVVVPLVMYNDIL